MVTVISEANQEANCNNNSTTPIQPSNLERFNNDDKQVEQRSLVKREVNDECQLWELVSLIRDNHRHQGRPRG
ncbi:hypothetical protein HZU73_07262 [Apis mellifera caucasica]|nr:hypothetical protein HZU73_07262 [Apis mellifera caucasica]